MYLKLYCNFAWVILKYILKITLQFWDKELSTCQFEQNEFDSTLLDYFNFQNEGCI